MAVCTTDHRANNTYTITFRFKTYPNLGFGFENKPSGNPDCHGGKKLKNNF
jgi:hypothetical protein